jgi:hypothetical protein
MALTMATPEYLRQKETGAVFGGVNPLFSLNGRNGGG